MKAKAGFQAPLGGGGAAASIGEIELPDGGEGLTLARSAAGILRKLEKERGLKWIAGEADDEALAAIDGVGKTKAGEADAKGVGDGEDVSCWAVRTLSTEPPLANPRLDATSFTTPASFAGSSRVPLLSPALMKTVEVWVVPLGNRPST
jgi:hypothetical protein